MAPHLWWYQTGEGHKISYMNRKFILLIILAAIIILAPGYFLLRTNSNLPTACTDVEEGMPVITSISPASGSVGSKVEVRGCNLRGFEGDKNVWIENIQGVKGILYGARDGNIPDSKIIEITLTSPVCQKDTSYSGLPCDAYLTLTPGIYKIYAMPWGKKSNEAAFTIK